MSLIKFRNLYAHEIQVRVDQISKKGATFLLYKDARCDMDILDETVGAENWQRKHEEYKGNLFCSVGINANYKNSEKDPLWVWKQDCGAESYAEKEKGESSDSFKRACVNWGIGKELYTKIRIFIPLPTEENGSKNGKTIYKLADPYVKFVVSKVEYEGKRIKHIEISDKQGVVAFTWGSKTKTPKTPEDAAEMVEQYFPCCSLCGKTIEDYRDANGKRVSAERHIEGSKAKHGDVYCASCITSGLV